MNRALLLVAGLAIGPSVALAQASRRLELGSPQRLLERHEITHLADVAIDGSGGAYVLDGSNQHVIRLDAAGKEAWKVGRKGSGPGEYQVAYHIAVRPSGGAAVLDWGTGQLTLLSSTGRVERVLRLPFSFSQLDAIAVLPDGRFAIAGMSGSRSAATRGSIHIFDDSLGHVRSFGPVATARDPEVVWHIGSGPIRVMGEGQIFLTLKRPYSAHLFDTSGVAVSTTSFEAPLTLDLADFMAITGSGARTMKSLTSKSRAVQFPVSVAAVPEGGYIGGRWDGETTTIDLMGADGGLQWSARRRAGCQRVLGVDVERRFIYCLMERDDVPGLQRLPYRIVTR